MTEKNRDFSQVRVGTVVGFDRSGIGHVKASKPYELFAKGEDARGRWFMFDGETEFASGSVDDTTWRVNGGYIISQPDPRDEDMENVGRAPSECASPDKTWGDVFWMWIRTGHDRSDAAYRADQWAERKRRRSYDNPAPPQGGEG